ncbi:MAG: PAC2 family protein [Pyrinomonadaceae bacterium]|nr:PAC2 family protein [Phycisphaerales bacterium]
MAELNAKPRPWLIAAWPGMGNVAIIAASYLIEQLSMVETGEFAPCDHFDVVEIDVKNGLVVPARLPRGVFFTWRNPGLGRDLVVFIGESQPSRGNYDYANKLLERASGMGVERVVTFASLASGLHPSENPRVSGAATDSETLADLRRVEVEPIADGQIGGLNGLILGLAARREMAGMCLLAEIPFFAMRVPNPKAARAALSVFSVMAGIDIKLEDLNKQAAYVDQALIDAMEQIERHRAAESHQPGELDENEESDPHSEAAEESGESQTREVQDTEEPPSDDVKLARADKARIEQLFEKARKDSSQAVRLKSELDRLGAFKQYEGQFLDLFRRAE